MTLARPKLGVTEQVIAEQVPLDSTVDDPSITLLMIESRLDGNCLGWICPAFCVQDIPGRFSTLLGRCQCCNCTGRAWLGEHKSSVLLPECYQDPLPLQYPVPPTVS